MPTPGKLHLQNLHFDKHNLAEMCENTESSKVFNTDYLSEFKPE